MKILLFIFILCCYFNSFSQKNQIKYNRAFVIYEGCDDAINKEKCYNNKSSEYFYRTLSDSTKVKLIKFAKKDTITFSARLFFDEEGYILKKSSKIFSSVDSTYKDIQYLLNKFPKTKPTLDEYNRGVATSVTSFHGFKIDSTKTELEPIKDFEPNEVPFEFLGKLPVFNGCDENLNNINLIKCMNNKLMQYIQKNFRGDLIADTVGLPAGVQSIFLFFKIDKEGKIQLDYVRAPHTILEREGERLIEGIPDAKSPGMLNDKAVTVPYFLPISFVVEDSSNTSNKDRKKRKKKRKS